MNTINQDEITQIVDDIYKERFQSIVERTEPVYEILDLPQTPIHAKSTFEPSDNDLWIFGYGSLMWKADFPFIECKNGFIEGFLRRFYQHSIDHRGNAKRPGRVVTLIPATPIDRVYGVAYRISAMEKDYVLKHLDYREKNGYQRCVTKFYEYSPAVADSDRTTLDIIVYIATSENESWAGDTNAINIRNIAKQIVTSIGESGTNRQYLFNLANSMKILFPDIIDDHIQELLEAVVLFIKVEEPIWLERLLKKNILDILILNSSSDGTIYITDKVDTLLHMLQVNCAVQGWRELFYKQISLNDI